MHFDQIREATRQEELRHRARQILGPYDPNIDYRKLHLTNKQLQEKQCQDELHSFLDQLSCHHTKWINEIKDNLDLQLFVKNRNKIETLGPMGLLMLVRLKVSVEQLEKEINTKIANNSKEAFPTIQELSWVIKNNNVDSRDNLLTYKLLKFYESTISDKKITKKYLLPACITFF